MSNFLVTGYKEKKKTRDVSNPTYPALFFYSM